MRCLGIFYLPLVLLSHMFAGPQQPSATTPGTSPQTVAPAYDTAILPKDRKAAWEMLRAASGLHGKQIKPWALIGHYKLSGPNGIVSVEGNIEIVWATPDRWRNTFIEDGISTTEWRTTNGTYTKMGKLDGLAYPRGMLLSVIEDPFVVSEISMKVPEFLKKEMILSTELSCFRNANLRLGGAGIATPSPFVLFCAEPDRPILRIAEAGYAVFLNKIALFQGQFVAREIVVRGDGGMTFQLDLDGLAVATVQQMQTLEPPKDSKLTGWISLPIDGHEDDSSTPPLLHRTKVVPPQYPQSMKSQRIEGTVRLEAIVGVDGSLTVADVLHSPNPELTQSAEDAVRQWKYEPYFLNGKAVEVHIQIAIHFQTDN
jgi:TonB family protein